MALSIEAFKQAGYDNVEEIGPQIWMVRDFFSKEDRDYIMDYVATQTEEDWLGHYMDHLRDKAEREFGTRDIETLQKEGKMEITFDWADKNTSIVDREVIGRINQGIEAIIAYDPNLVFSGAGTIQRQYEGSDLKIHVDNHVDPYTAYAGVVYVNDEYNFGELVFPEQGIEIKPDAGTLMLFFGGESHPHGVNPPGPGPLRYVLPCFIKYLELPEGYVHKPSAVHLKYKTTKKY